MEGNIAWLKKEYDYGAGAARDWNRKLHFADQDRGRWCMH